MLGQEPQTASDRESRRVSDPLSPTSDNWRAAFLSGFIGYMRMLVLGLLNHDKPAAAAKAQARKVLRRRLHPPIDLANRRFIESSFRCTRTVLLLTSICTHIAGEAGRQLPTASKPAVEIMQKAAQLGASSGIKRQHLFDAQHPHDAEASSGAHTASTEGSSYRTFSEKAFIGPLQGSQA